MKISKKIISVLLAVFMICTMIPITAVNSFAVTSGDFEYRILSETDRNCAITDYTGSAKELIVPAELDGYAVTSIGDNAFYWCRSLTSVTIPNSVTTIGNHAFAYCASLLSATISDSVMTIGNEAFGYCTSLENIVVSDANEMYSSMDGVLFNKGKTKLIFYPEGKSDTEYIIPDSVMWIGNNAFEKCTALTSVTMPDSVTKIGDFAFNNCTSLANVTISNGVTSTGMYTFNGCTSLTSVTIPDSVTTIDGYTFEGCTSLTSVTIPDSVTTIGTHAFHNTACYNNKTNWDYGVFYIDNRIIEVKEDVSGICIIRTGTKIIPNYAFDGCGLLTSVTIPGSVTEIGWRAFGNCTSLANVTISNGVTSIGADTFVGCTSLTSVTIPDSVTSIGSSAFEGCTSLTSVTIPDSVTRILSHTFVGCTALTTVTIPDSVTEIGWSVFDGCDLRTIYGYKGTEAERYATKNNINFVVICKHADLKEVPYKAPTCTEDGNNQYFVCNECGMIFKDDGLTVTTVEAETLPMKGHTLVHHNRIEATCTIDGSVEYYSCTECGKFFSDSNGKNEITSIVIPAAGHSFGDWVVTKEATETEDGEKTRTCSTCGLSETERIPMLKPTTPDGDVNGDGKISAIDARWVLQLTAGNKTLTEEENAAADVNGDGSITALDARAILKISAGN